MLHWTHYKGHTKNTYKTRKGIVHDDTIYTFDIEATTGVLYQSNLHKSDYWDNISDVDKKDARVYSWMYIWQFSIDDIVYYGRTWEEFREFYNMVFDDPSVNSIVYVHNLAYECQFIRGVIPITSVFARQKYKPIYITSNNVEFRCSYYLTQAKLEDLPKYYGLTSNKLTGNLDYSKIRHSDTILTQQELDYCEYDCIVLYEFVTKMLAEYKHLNKIPLTKTGILRRKVKAAMKKSSSFTGKMYDISNTDVDLYNTEVRAFAGGYTHANFYLADVIHENVQSFDLCSSYPFVMACEKVFPTTRFEKDDIAYIADIQPNRIYLLHLQLSNVSVKKQNTIISVSKCFHLSTRHYIDNGRILSADSFEIVCTNFDYEAFTWFYDFDVEIIEAWSATAGYLPKDFIAFILDIYEKKTTLKGVPGREDEYARAKSDFNSLYGMTVTNTIKDEVLYEFEEWDVYELTKVDIIEKLIKEDKKKFLNFAYGVFVTSRARYNLLSVVQQLDKYNAYSDTDSCKLTEGFDKSVINRYNIGVIKKIIEAKKYLGLSGFTQKDIKGNNHTLGILEYEETYKKFITLGAKKYCYVDQNDEIHITVAGVPKCGAKVLNTIDDFEEDLVFPSSITGKLQAVYNEEKDINLTVTDYNNVTKDIKFSYGVGFVPCSYTLSQSSFMITDSDAFIPRRLAV